MSTSESADQHGNSLSSLFSYALLSSEATVSIIISNNTNTELTLSEQSFIPVIVNAARCYKLNIVKVIINIFRLVWDF